MTLNEFWSHSDESRSQRFYVALCEFTSALLDYATGTDLLGRKAISPSTWRLDGTPPDMGRLNWASTCLYYSLVHMGRTVVFLPLGDFPRGHNELAGCFVPESDDSQTDPRVCPTCNRPFGRRKTKPTDWLCNVTRGLRDRDERITGVHAALPELIHFWRGLPGNDRDPQEQVENTLQRFGTALRRAKELRNDNNYEALLIAHEYDHEVMTEAFKALATAMKGLADKWLESLGVWFARYLQARTGEQWDCAPEAKIGFAKPFLKDGVLGAIEVWYGPETARAVGDFMRPIAALPEPADRASADKIDRGVNFDMFSPKKSLMQGFEKKVWDLGRLLDEAPGPRPQSS